MYNKNRFRKLNEKKVLHKIGKRWVVISVSLLGVLGLGGLVSRSVHADVQTAPSQASSQSRAVLSQASLVTPSSAASQSSSVNNVDPQSSSRDLNSQVRTLYQQIINNAQRNVSLHQNHLVNNNQTNSNGRPSQSPVNAKVIQGQWGTAPFSFNPQTGLLQTTGKGVIVPISKLGKDNGQFKLQDVKDIKFAPGTQAPSSATVSDGALFGATLDPVQTTDGPSDSTAYVSELCNLSDIDCTNLDTSNMTSMGGMFKNDTGLKAVQFGPKFDTHNVTEMSVMFYNDIDLQSLDLSRFDTSNVEGLTSMFQSDYALSDLNLGSRFDTGKVAYMSDVFHSDNSLKSLDLGNQFYVSNNYSTPVNLSDMFKDDYSLRHLNLGPHFNTMQVNNMSDMFANDSDMNSLNLGDQFYTGQVPDMHNMFKGNTNLQSLNLGSHFDTLSASQSSYNNSVTDGDNTINHDYNGAQDIFAGDTSLNHLIMNNTRLAGPVNLPQSVMATWRGSTGNNADLTDGGVYSGDYGRYATRPVQKTCLDLVDPNGKSIGDVFVSGLAGTNVPFAAISNVLGDGYRPVITTRDIITTFPNSPYKYVAGVVKVNVTKDGNSSYNGNSVPVSGAISQGTVNAYAASAADQRIESSELASVASSVSTANASKARRAAQLADERIGNYYKDSVKASVATANQAVARKAEQSADQKIITSLSNSVTASVSAANQSKASQAAQSADQSISTSLSDSVAASVSIANHLKASQAAETADASLESSIVKSYAQSADQKLDTSLRASVAASVKAANQSKASQAARAADQRIQSSIAASAASSADAKIMASERASVSDSISNANQSRADQAIKSADQRIATSYSNSVAASISLADQSRADQATRAANQRIQSSIAASAASSADAKIAASERASVATSISVADASAARSATRSADNRLIASERQSISASVASSDQDRAKVAASSADQKLRESLQNSVAASVSVKNQRDAEEAAQSADQKIETSAAESGARSADQQLESSIAASYASVADARIEKSLRASILGSLSNINKQLVHTNGRLRTNDGSNTIQAKISASATDNELSRGFSPSASFTSSSALATPVNPESQDDSSSSVLSNGTSLVNTSVSNQSTASVEHHGVDHARAREAVVTQIPVRRRYFMVIRDCLAHNHIWSVGKVKDYSAVLHRHMTGWLEKAFRFRRGRHTFYRYEIKLGRRHYFITANRFFVKTSRRRFHRLNHQHH